MIKGKFWPIPEDKILDGTLLALKNADRLSKDAKILFENKKYSSAIALSTLALEEFGKHCLLLREEFTNHQRQIDTKIWHNEFENHKAKLNSIIEHIRKFLTRANEIEAKKQIDELEQYLLRLADTKIQTLYVDWDGENNDWFYYDDCENKEEDAKEAVKTIQWMIENYIYELGGDRDLIFTLPMKIIELLQQNKIHGMCKKCGMLLFNGTELVTHRNVCSQFVSWYWNPNEGLTDDEKHILDG